MSRTRIAALLSLVMLLAAPASAAAADGPSYPPAPAQSPVAVEGVQSGITPAGPSASTMPHTGFDPTFVILGAVVLLIGVALVLITYRRQRTR